MDQPNSTSPAESKNKNRVSFTENATANKDQKQNSTSGLSSWKEGRRPEHISKKRKHSHDTESWSSSGTDRGFAVKTQDNFREEEPKETPRDEQQSFQTYAGYANGTTTDTTYMNNNRNSIGMMSVLSPYGPIAAVAQQWAMNPLDGLNPSMDMSANTGAGMAPYTYLGMGGDPNLYGMMGMANYGQFGMMGSENGMMMAPVREVLHFNRFKLYPRNLNKSAPNLRPRPLGCKTIFVGFLPENATEEMLREIFDRCGEISVVRRSKKEFCHIRFADELQVENALYFSGYRMKIDNKEDSKNNSVIHVDYATARDDQYDYECRQRAEQRAVRHRKLLEVEFSCPPTPPTVAHYSDHEAALLGDKLRNEQTFQQAVLVLITWLERGECNKRNAGFFYSMIQSTNSHVRRLMNEKGKYEDELAKAKLMLKQQMQGILLQFNEIGKVFNASSVQKVWDHFTKAQRKNIELWKKQTEEIKNAHVEEVLNERIEDEMDLSDDEGDTVSKKNSADDFSVHPLSHEDRLLEEIEKLKEENDSLRCQLEASQNEIVIVRSETEQEREIKDHQIHSLRAALQAVQKEVLTLNKRALDIAELKELRTLKLRNDGKHSGESCHEQDDQGASCVRENVEIDMQRESFSYPNGIVPNSNNSFAFLESEARLVSCMSAFLNVHPFGASVDYICSYLQQFDYTVVARDVEVLLKKFQTVFKEISTGIGASLEKKWTFIGFQFRP